MRRAPWLGLVIVLAGCAGAGTSSIFPEAGDPNAAIANAERQIAEAVTAGADSLASQPLAEARQSVAEAKVLLSDRKQEPAALKGRAAAADAIYAREQARRIQAERTRSAALASLNQLPPMGGAQ
ncbi:MAG TPA: hypothetical protein VMM77_01935 [Gemmatimonadaceae bacterium]|nr:hypothetical protein [Gemmatimonadaceae bacterium]